MKKRFTAPVLTVIIAVLLSAIPLNCFALFNPVYDINENLVAHWDFEGTSEEALLDKAPSGAKKDNLTVKGEKVTVSDGIAYIPNDAGNHLTASYSEDLTHLTGMTVYLKVKCSGTNTAYADMLVYTSNYRIYKRASSESSEGAIIETKSISTGSFGITSRSELRPAENQWFYIAVTMQVDKASKTGNCTIYSSTDGINYFATSTNKTNLTDTNLTNMETAINNTNAILSLGKDTSGNDRLVSYWFDDVRVYDKVLSEDEIKSVSGETPLNNIPVFAGTQETLVGADGTQSIRFIGTIDSLEYSRVGFRISVTYSPSSEEVTKSVDRSCSNVYYSLTASDTDGNISQITATELGGTYIFALSVTQVPCNVGTMTFNVVPYAVSTDGITVYEGSAATVIYSDGIWQSSRN